MSKFPAGLLETRYFEFQDQVGNPRKDSRMSKLVVEHSETRQFDVQDPLGISKKESSQYSKSKYSRTSGAACVSMSQTTSDIKEWS